MAQGSDGVDLAAVYQLLSEVADAVRGHGNRLEVVERKLNDVIGTVNEHTRRFDEVAAVLNEHGRKLDDVRHDLTSLQDRVGDYHHAVVGQGMALNGIEERVRRLELHLGLDRGE